MNRKSQQAFTLIELMVVVAIIGILAGIAIPIYGKYINKSVCENGKAVLVGAAQMLERYSAQNNKYQGANLVNFGYNQAPVDGKAQFKIELAHPNGPRSYKLTATPLVGSKLEGKGTLTIDNLGSRDATGVFKNNEVWKKGCNGL